MVGELKTQFSIFLQIIILLENMNPMMYICWGVDNIVKCWEFCQFVMGGGSLRLNFLSQNEQKLSIFLPIIILIKNTNPTMYICWGIDNIVKR